MYIYIYDFPFFVWTPRIMSGFQNMCTNNLIDNLIDFNNLNSGQRFLKLLDTKGKCKEHAYGQSRAILILILTRWVAASLGRSVWCGAFVGCLAQWRTVQDWSWLYSKIQARMTNDIAYHR